MKKIIIGCSLLVIISLATQAQEIPPVQNKEVRTPIKSTVLLKSELNHDTLQIDEKYLINLLEKRANICCDFEVTDEGKIKKVAVIFTDDEDFSGAFFEGNISEEDTTKITYIRCLILDDGESYRAIFNNTNQEIALLLVKLLEQKLPKCKGEMHD